MDATRTAATVSRPGLFYGLAAVATGVLVGATAALRPPLAPAMALALTGTVVLIAAPRLLTYAFVALFPFIAALPRGLIPVLKLDELMIMAGLVFALARPGAKRWRWTELDPLFLALVLAGTALPAFGALLRAEPPEMMEAVALLKPYLIYRLVLMTIDDRRHLRLILRLLLASSIVVGLIALLQIANVPGVRLALAFAYGGGAAAVGSTVTTLRATATLGNWNALGAYAAFGVCLSLVALRHGRAITGGALLPGVALVANLASLILAGSSSSLIGALIAVGVWWWYRRPGHLRARHVFATAAVGIVALVLAATLGGEVIERQIARQTQGDFRDRATGEVVETHGLPQSVVGRWVLARYLLEVMAEDGYALVTGFGAGEAARDRLPWGTAESGYMSMVFYYGPLYLILYLGVLTALAGMVNRLRRTSPVGDELGRGVATTALGVIAAMLVINLISSYYSAAGVTHYFWIVAAATTFLLKEPRQVARVEEIS